MAAAETPIEIAKECLSLVRASLVSIKSYAEPEAGEHPAASRQCAQMSREALAWLRDNLADIIKEIP